MVAVLEKLLTLAKEGRLTVHGVSISNEAYEIAIGDDNAHFTGDIKLAVEMDTDVIYFGTMLSNALKEDNEK